MTTGSELGGILGAAIGFVASGFNPVGAQYGFIIGSAIGSYISPTKINGPKLGDGQRQTSLDGQPIPWILGTAPIVGTIAQASETRQIKVKDSGKGAPEVSHYERVQDFAIEICESCELRDSKIVSCIMVVQDGKLVYDVRPGSTMMDDSIKWASNITFQYGAEDQLPHPTMEMDTGVGNTAAYRGVATMIADGFNITKAGGRIPTFQFVMSSNVYPRSFDFGHNVTGGFIVGGAGSAITPDNTLRLSTISLPAGGGWPFYVHCQVISTLFGPNTYGRLILREDIPDGLILWDTGWIGDANVNEYINGYFGNQSVAGLDATITNNVDTVIYTGDRTTDNLIQELYTYIPAGLEGGGIPVVGFGANYYAARDEVQGQTFPLPLGVVIERICKRGGLRADQIDVSGLPLTDVWGYPIARPCSGIEALTPLVQTYFLYGSEYDGQMHFLPRGADAVMTIFEEDLLVSADANNGNVTSSLRNMETQFPRKMIGAYIDPAQNYTTVTVSDDRLAIDVKAIGTQNFAMPVVLPANDALAATIKAMKVQYAALEGTQTYSLPFATKNNVYLRLVAGDAVLFRGKRWEITNVKMSIDHITLSTVYSRQSAFDPVTVQAITGKAPTVPSSPYSGPTTLVPFNSPALRPQDTTGIYMGAASATGSDNWRSCVVQASYDDQATWTNALTISTPSVMGKVTAVDPLTVQMNDELYTVTEAQLSANANAFAIVHASGTELMQFREATEVSGSPDLYVLNGLVHGGLGTPEVAAAVDEDIVMLDNVYFLPIDPSFAGRRIYFRAIGAGESVEDAEIVSVVYNPMGQPEMNIRVDEYGDVRVDEYGNQRVTY